MAEDRSDDDNPDGTVTLTIAELNSQLAAARRSGEGKAAQRAERGPTAIERIEASMATLAETVGKLAQPTAPEQRPAPAAAPSAPTAHTLPTSHTGIVDIFQPGVAEKIGPHETRRALEALWAIGADRDGQPRRPTVGRKKG